jgi:hypothetical protein
MDAARRIATLEKRVAKLEKAAEKFEQHRQAWINLNKQLKVMKREIDAEAKLSKSRLNLTDA